MLASPKALDLLAQHGGVSVIDVSFELTELGFYLTSILVVVAGILVPVTWFITDTLTVPNFEWFLGYTRNLAGGGQWNPAVCFADFEPALRGAISQVFPACLVYGDSCHFYHDNHKWIRANGGIEYLCSFYLLLTSSLRASRYAEQIDQSLHILWHCVSENEFTSSMAGFLNYWANTWGPYATYFSKTWCEISTEWALFARPSGILHCTLLYYSSIYNAISRFANYRLPT